MIPKTGKMDRLVEEASLVIFETETRALVKRTKTKLVITPSAVTITISKFLTKEEYPIPLGVIQGARIYKSILYASLTIEVYKYQAPPVVKYLTKEDAMTARDYILALITCRENKIDLTKYSLKELKEKLMEIGKREK